MDFAAVFLEKTGKNIACTLLEKGLLKTNLLKNGENASKFLEDLLAAEKKAVDGKLALHGKSDVQIRTFNDLSISSKKAKDFEQLIRKRVNKKMNGVVEYCYSGQRFKIRIDSENVYVNFSLLGIKTPSND